jgi:hypothetical protein
MTTNADLTLIAVLVDRSGSMAQWREDMEGGLNAFVESQASEPGETRSRWRSLTPHTSWCGRSGRSTMPRSTH